MIDPYMKHQYQSRVGLCADHIAIPDLAGTETRLAIWSVSYIDQYGSSAA